MDNIQTQPQPKSNSAFYTFLYLLSLISLGFMAISTGSIFFQIINKRIPDILAPYYQGRYDASAIRFAIAAILVASPIYFFSTILINKKIRSGELKKDATARRWLTYFIILVSSMVIIGTLIAIIYNFLEGEITTRFLLKTLTIFAIAGTILSYYIYDMKREIVVGEKNKIVRIYFYTTAAAIIITLILAMFMAESPLAARNSKYDTKIIESMDSIRSSIDSMLYQKDRQLPENLDEILNSNNFYSDKDFAKQNITYKIKSSEKYELCAEFKTSSKDANSKGVSSYYNGYYNDQQWQHEAGYQCIEKEIGAGIKNSRNAPMLEE